MDINSETARRIEHNVYQFERCLNADIDMRLSPKTTVNWEQNTQQILTNISETPLEVKSVWMCAGRVEPSFISPIQGAFTFPIVTSETHYRNTVIDTMFSDDENMVNLRKVWFKIRHITVYRQIICSVNNGVIFVPKTSPFLKEQIKRPVLVSEMKKWANC